MSARTITGLAPALESLPKRLLLAAAIDGAREMMEREALATDDPMPGVVEASDYLDLAAECLARDGYGEGS